jgi:hypothetical protein
MPRCKRLFLPRRLRSIVILLLPGGLMQLSPSCPKPPSPRRGAWWLVIRDDSEQAGALGYQAVTTEGLPLGKVFAGTDLKFGSQWTITTSHELLEMLADPEIDLTVFVQPNAHTGILYAYEVCDVWGADNLGYKIYTTPVSDFVFPAWFESFRKPGSTQFDYGKHIKKPFELLPIFALYTTAILPPRARRGVP